METGEVYATIDEHTSFSLNLFHHAVHFQLSHVKAMIST